jgi:cbb3-type cytochrome oxidase subunit 3
MSLFLALVDWLHRYDIVAMMLVFVLIFAATYWPQRKPQIERHGHIPLHDDR